MESFHFDFLRFVALYVPAQNSYCLLLVQHDIDNGYSVISSNVTNVSCGSGVHFQIGGMRDHDSNANSRSPQHHIANLEQTI